MNNKLIRVLLSIMLLPVIFLGCGISGERQSGGSPVFSSYRDIPGVTGEEIEAIEAIREQREYFTFGMMPSIEAFLDRDGEIKGFTAIFCEWLTELFGIRFIPGLVSWNELLEGLGSGEVDFTGELTAGDERRQTYIMTDAIAQRALKYLRLADSAPIPEIAKTRLPRYALLEGTTTVRDVFFYAEEEFEPVYISDLGAAYELLKTGQADALIYENTSEAFFDVYGDVVTENFLPLVYSTVSFTAQNPELAPFISVVQKSLENGAIRYLNEIYNQGYKEYMKHKLFMRLNEEERAYINTRPVVPFAAESYNYPISFYSVREKEWQGICFDVLREIESLTGLEFAVIHEGNTEWPVLLKMLEDGDALIISELVRTKEREGRFLWPNSSFLTDNAALISKTEHRNIDVNEVLSVKVGFTRSGAYSELFLRWFPDHKNTVEYDSVGESFEALMRGEVDMKMTNGAKLLYLTNYLELPGYKANIVFDYSFESTFGFNKDAAVLCGVVDKALELIDADAISGQWLRRTYDYRVKLAEANMSWIIGTVPTLILILIFLSALYMKNIQKSKTIAGQSAVLSAIYNSIPAMVFTKDLNNVYTSINSRFIEETGIDESEAIGRKFQEIDGHDIYVETEFIEADRRVIEENITVTTEGWYSFFDKYQAKQIIRTPLIQDGKVAGLLGIVMDITERKLAEEAAAKAHEQARIMLDTIPTISCMLINTDHEVFDCNKEALRLYDLNEKQELIDRFYDLSPEYQPCGRKSKEFALELISQAHDEGYCRFEWMHQKLNGEPIPCEVTLIQVEFDDEVIVAGYSRDLRELKATEEKARETEMRMQLMLDTMPLACDLINQDYEIIDCNQEALNLFGVRDKEEYREKFFDLSPELQPCGRLSRELTYEYLDKAFDAGYHRFEWLHQKRGGEPLPCEVTLVRVRHRGEYIIASYIRDLREQKAVIEEMRRAEIAEESSKTKSKFLAMMSHEIRTPMNAILGITEIHLQDEALESKYEEAFSRIYSSSNMLLGIINDLLDMSKIEAGKLELDLAVYETTSLVNDVVNLNLERFGGKELKFELEADENTPAELIGDELRIRQILNNLLLNSFKYTKQGTVKLSVSAEAGGEKESRVTLVFRVSDTGVGMTEEQVAMLFDEYSRFDTEANRLTEGVGLGMRITRGLVSLMDGEIKAESEPGRGTTINVRLPQEDAGAGVLGMDAVENLRRFENKAAYARKSQVAYEPMPYGRVLVVDDSDLNLYVARGLLAPYELVIDVKESGFEAIDMVKNGQEYDIVFMDHMMPEMDGIETVKNIRGLGYSRPIVALTADAVSGRADMFLKSGFDDFISKPIDIRYLDAVLKKFIRDRHPREVVEAARAVRKRKKEAEISESKVASEFLSALNKIGAINAKIGLSRFSGVEDMYYNTLALFHKKLPRECDTMSDLMSANDIKGFSIAVHSMKSQLATIGAMGLSKTAQALETASKNNEMDYCVNNFPAFKKDMLVLHEQLSAVFPGEEASSAEKTQREPGDPEYLREHIEKALEAAGDFDQDSAIKAISELQAYDYDREISALLNDAMAALDDFDFDTASEILGRF